jgi:hypothetical protein
MGKHDSGYERVDKDFYPTPPWVTGALCEYMNVGGLRVWEPACGNGRMSEPLKAAGAIVRSTDIEDRGYTGFDGRFDFLSDEDPPFDFDRIITNPAWGEGNAWRRPSSGLGSAAPRAADRWPCCCRPTSTPASRGASSSATPKENVAWFNWARDPQNAPPTVQYSRHHAALKADYPDIPPPTRFDPGPGRRSDDAMPLFSIIDGGLA